MTVREQKSFSAKEWESLQKKYKAAGWIVIEEGIVVRIQRSW